MNRLRKDIQQEEAFANRKHVRCPIASEGMLDSAAMKVIAMTNVESS